MDEDEEVPSDIMFGSEIDSPFMSKDLTMIVGDCRQSNKGFVERIIAEYERQGFTVVHVDLAHE